MEETKTIEGNELIETWMEDDWGLYDNYIWQNHGAYNESWDRLMPVVERIENIKNGEGNFLFSVDMGRDFGVIKNNDFEQKTLFVKSVPNNKILSMWLTIIEFIAWHNSNLPK